MDKGPPMIDEHLRSRLEFDRSRSTGLPQRDPELVLRRGTQARDHQLPDLPAREGRAVLRADLRAGARLGMPLRQVQGHQVQGDHLRSLRRQGHPQPGPPQAHGPHQPGRAGDAHLVLQVDPQPPGHAPGHEEHGPGEDHLLPGLRGHRSRRTPLEGRQLLTEEDYREAIHKYGNAFKAAMGAEAIKVLLERSDMEALALSSARPLTETSSQQKVKDLTKRLKLVNDIKNSSQQARVDGPGGHPGHPAGPAASGAAGRRQLRHQRPERSLSPDHQPEQPAQEADRPQRPGGHHPQRETDAPAGGGFAVGQRPVPRPVLGSNNRPLKMPDRHDQGQAGPLPREPPGQAGGLLGPFGDRGRTQAEALSVRSAQEDRPGALQPFIIRGSSSTGTPTPSRAPSG